MIRSETETLQCLIMNACENILLYVKGIIYLIFKKVDFATNVFF